jgi:ParB family chromosome partitioning protein
VSREAVGRLVGYVGQSPFVFSGTITENIAYGFPEATPEQIERVARRIVDHGLSVRQTEEAVAHLVQPLVRKTEKQRIVDPNVREAENTLQEALGVRVTIDDRKGKGKILIEYSSLEDFDRIIEALGGKKMD